MRVPPIAFRQLRHAARDRSKGELGVETADGFHMALGPVSLLPMQRVHRVHTRISNTVRPRVSGEERGGMGSEMRYLPWPFAPRQTLR